MTNGELTDDDYPPCKDTHSWIVVAGSNKYVYLVCAVCGEQVGAKIEEGENEDEEQTT